MTVDLKLLGYWASPFVIRPMIALNLKQLDYEFVEQPAWIKSKILVESNPVYKKIPVLLHNGRPICESLVIVEYIDDAWRSEDGTSILPTDAYDRAIARFWVTYIEDKILAGIRGAMKANTHEEKSATAEQLISSLRTLEDAFDGVSKGKRFFGGDTIGYVDIALGAYLGWIRAMEWMYGIEILSEATSPRLAKWAAAFLDDAAVKGVVPEPERLADYHANVLQALWKGQIPPTSTK